MKTPTDIEIEMNHTFKIWAQYSFTNRLVLYYANRSGFTELHHTECRMLLSRVSKIVSLLRLLE